MEKQDNQTRLEIHAFIIKNNIKAAALGLSQEHNTDDAKEYLIATNTILNAIYVVKKQYILEMKNTNKGPDSIKCYKDIIVQDNEYKSAFQEVNKLYTKYKNEIKDEFSIVKKLVELGNIADMTIPQWLIQRDMLNLYISESENKQIHELHELIINAEALNISQDHIEHDAKKFLHLIVKVREAYRFVEKNYLIEMKNTNQNPCTTNNIKYFEQMLHQNSNYISATEKINKLCADRTTDIKDEYCIITKLIEIYRIDKMALKQFINQNDYLDLYLSDSLNNYDDDEE